MAYELLRRSTGNLVGTYEAEADALEYVIRLAERAGSAAAENLALGFESPDGQTTLIADGPALLLRAHSMREAQPGARAEVRG